MKLLLRRGMHKYRLTPSAKSDLIEIWNYTVETWGAKKAEKYLQDIEDKLNQLAANPELGRRRPEISPGYYSFLIRKHTIVERRQIILQKKFSLSIQNLSNTFSKYCHCCRFHNITFNTKLFSFFLVNH